MTNNPLSNFGALRVSVAVLCMFLVVAWAALSEGQEVSRAYKIAIKDGKTVAGEAVLPLDMIPRIHPQYSGANSFGLTVEEKRITCSQQGSIWSSLMVDSLVSNPFDGFNVQPQLPTPLPPLATGKKRLGTQSTWKHGNIHVTQIVEIVPGTPTTKTDAPGQKRRLDTCRMTYVLENKDQKAHKVAFKTSIDILIVNNDGALYASPTTAPGKILNGVALQGKKIPAYLWVLERPELDNPGFIATMTLKHGKGENPNKVVLANLGVVANFMQWDVAPVPAGDSACALFWEEKELKPGEKRVLVWGYGGGISPGSDGAGQVTLDLGGSFEPNKLFTIAAHVEDPALGQTLALELPAGMQRIEGREIEPVAPATESGSSVVLWKCRVIRPGDHEIRIRSSTGSVQSKHVSIRPVETR